MTRNLIFVSHCNFHGNSAMHLFSIANTLTDLGHCCAVCVPKRPETVLDHGQPRFQVLDYEEGVLFGVSFPNGRDADLVHAWTPREPVHKTTMSLVRRYNAPYFVHLEDNEITILLDELPRWSLKELDHLPTRALDAIVPNHCIHPHHWRRLLAGAAGVTVLIDRLLEFRPSHVPGMVFFPGYDGEFAKISGRDEALRTALGIGPDELLVVYNGSIHKSNWREVRSLVLAIALVNRRGLKAKLVKTGWTALALPELSDPEIAQYVIDRGFVARDEIPRFLAAADALVQPGRSSEFNDYRFPSKLPEFLVSGRPVVLPRSNLGLRLKDGEEALLLNHGDSVEIADALQRLATDPELRIRIGRHGRTFALENLDWAKNIAAVPNFYDECLGDARRTKTSFRTNCEPALPEPVLPKLIAFYQPQFHSIPENDAWRDKGFTAWTNTVAARPNFKGHVQPRLPSDLGFYDLRLPEAMDAQIKMARCFGVFGFCFYYYWFHGPRLLNRLLDQYLKRRDSDFPFCICWANENWTGCRDGQENEILVKQEYGEDFSVNFISDIIPILKHPRYISVGGAPVLLVYCVSSLPDPRNTAEIWREQCREAGIPSIHLVVLQSFGITDPRPFGFDAAVEFPPHTRRFLIDSQTLPAVNSTFEGYLEDYEKVVIDQLARPLPDYTLYRTVMPSWDNTPRRKNRANIFVNSSPRAYQAWLRCVTAQALALAEAQEPLVFVNAWNEWEGGAIRTRCPQRVSVSRGYARWFRGGLG